MTANSLGPGVSFIHGLSCAFAALFRRRSIVTADADEKAYRRRPANSQEYRMPRHDPRSLCFSLPTGLI